VANSVSRGHRQLIQPTPVRSPLIIVRIESRGDRPRTCEDPIIHKAGARQRPQRGLRCFGTVDRFRHLHCSWVKPRLLPTILYACGEFDEDSAVATVLDFIKLAEYQAAIF
jgi:hypothetical protein